MNSGNSSRQVRGRSMGQGLGRGKQEKEGDPAMGARLMRARDAAGYTGLDVATAVGVTNPTFSRYETGDINVPTSRLKRIAAFLRVDVQDLMREPPPSASVTETIDLSKVAPEDRWAVRRSIEGIVEAWKKKDEG